MCREIVRYVLLLSICIRYISNTINLPNLYYLMMHGALILFIKKISLLQMPIKEVNMSQHIFQDFFSFLKENLLEKCSLTYFCIGSINQIRFHLFTQNNLFFHNIFSMQRKIWNVGWVKKKLFWERKILGTSL